MNGNKSRSLVLLPAALLLLLLAAGVAAASTPPVDRTRAEQPLCRPALTESQRYGFVATLSGWPATFDVARLGAGWAEDMTLVSRAPGLDRALLLRTPYGYQVDATQLGPLVDANPGATWLIGNEPDCIWQDDVPPEEYARIYHDLYTFVKSRDASSRVAAGGIVQPTPLRLHYLDLVLTAHQARYHQALPTDAWHIHNAILNEERDGWGAGIPPGIAADQGVLRAMDDNDDQAIFQEQVWAFRRWLAERGYGGYPLLITEFGVLLPALDGFDAARVAQYMSGTFAFLAAAADPDLGDPSDGGRLVQRWAWFSLDVPPYEQNPAAGFNGNLFDPKTAAITAHGLHYESLTAGLPAVSYAELGLARWRIEPVGRPVAATETVTLPVAVRVGNGGTAAAGAFTVRLDYAGPSSGSLELPVAGGLAPAASTWLTFTLAGLAPGAYDVSLTLDALGQVPEPAECDNQVSHELVVPAHVTDLPLVARAGSDDPAAAATGRVLAAAARAAERSPQAGGSAFREFSLPQAGSYPGQITYDPASGALWLTERDGNRLARFDPGSETWTEYAIPTPGSRPWGLALDGAGGLWFAETAGNRIGRLNLADGTFAEYPIPTANSEPWGVAAAQGAVWFTERMGNKIGRLDLVTRVITEHPEQGLPTLNAMPAGAGAGISAGVWYLWFAESNGDRLGRLRMADRSVVETRTVPTPNAGLEDVALQDGNPWVTEMLGNKINLWLPTTIADFHPVYVPTANSEPYGITFDPVKRVIWFTERAGNNLVRYTSGELAKDEYRLPTAGSMPTDVVVDAAGCAWYAAPGSNRIGRLCLADRSRNYLPLVTRP